MKPSLRIHIPTHLKVLISLGKTFILPYSSPRATLCPRLMMHGCCPPVSSPGHGPWARPQDAGHVTGLEGKCLAMVQKDPVPVLV